MSQLPHRERNRVYKFNGGRGAVLCSWCSTMVCSGLGPDTMFHVASTIYKRPIFSEAGHVFCCEGHRTEWAASGGREKESDE